MEGDEAQKLFDRLCVSEFQEVTPSLFVCSTSRQRRQEAASRTPFPPFTSPVCYLCFFSLASTAPG